MLFIVFVVVKNKRAQTLEEIEVCMLCMYVCIHTLSLCIQV